jgi:DNA modification methylase
MMKEILAGERRWTVETGDSLEVMRSLPDNSVDSVVTDPPAGISFMAEEWDTDRGGREGFIAWLRSVMVECERVLKPGGHCVVWSIPKTSHWTAMAVETAGFEIRDVHYHIFGSGFPHGADISKAIDEAFDLAREVKLKIDKIQCNGPVPSAGDYSPPSERISEAPLTEGSAHGCAQTPVGAGKAIPSGTDTVVRTGTSSPMSDLTSKSSNIVSSWRRVLEDLLVQESTFTTSTKTSLITDLKTLSSCLSRITHENITLAEILSSGSFAHVQAADAILNGVRIKMVIARSAQELASIRVNTRSILGSESPTGESVTQRAISVDEYIIGRKKLAEVTSEELHAVTGLYHWASTRTVKKAAAIAKFRDRYPYLPIPDGTKVLELRTFKSLSESFLNRTRVSADGVYIGDAEITPYKPWKTSSLEAHTLVHGTGGMNVGGCSIKGESVPINKLEEWSGFGQVRNPEYTTTINEKGRWPAHLSLEHTPLCQKTGTTKIPGHKGYPNGPGGSVSKGTGQFTPSSERRPNPHPGRADADGNETVDCWECQDGCPVKELDEQSGTLTSGSRAEGVRKGMGYGGANGDGGPAIEGSNGGASRYFTVVDSQAGLCDVPFFYAAKAPRKEKEAGLEGFTRQQVNDGRDTSMDTPYQRGDTERLNSHPTVKNLKLMRHLCRLVTPPGGVILDPYAGSGSTGCAAMLEGFRFIGIELDVKHCETARARISHWEKENTTK